MTTKVALGLMSAGLMLKSALFPLHFWLPPAHANAPAPVSAALSALVVKAAVYLMMRLWLDLFAPALAPGVAWLPGLLGAAAVLWGSWRALRADATADSGLDAAVAEMDGAGPAGRAFREFALGFNPELAIPLEGRRWIPYYGYGAGVVRLSLGDNTELGGAVGGGYVRWNFFTDATVTVDGEVWVEDGRLIR